jgi:Protein of unknown function (DUF2012)
MFVLLVLSAVYAASISGEVFPPKNPADRKSWSPAPIKVEVDGKFVTYLDSSSNFIVHGIPDGLHLLEITDYKFIYKPVIIKVAGNSITVKENYGSKADKAIYPLRIQAERKISYFEEREGFSIWSILMNPMLLMSGLMLGVAFLSPKMKLDPEQLNEMKEMQKQMNSGWMSSLLNPPSIMN